MELLIRTDWPQFSNDLADVVRIFKGSVPWKTEPLALGAEEAGREDLLVLSHTEQAENGAVRVFVEASGAYAGRAEEAYRPGGDPLVEKRLHKRAIKLAAYRLLKEATGITPPWGSLTGIRPTRLVYA